MVVGQRIVLGLLVLSLLAGVVTGSQLYYRLSILWALLLFGSWIMSILALRGIRVRRVARMLRSQVGQIFEERFEIINPGRLPRLWIEVRDESPLPGSRGSHVLTLIGGHESRSYLARTRLLERGVFPRGPTTLISGDLFGLFPVSRSFPTLDTLIVYPIMYEVHSFPNPPGLLPGGEALRRRTPQITSNAAGVREYAPGDPLNRIHWLSTAHRNRLIVKEFELDPLAEVWLFLDALRTVHVSQAHNAPMEDAQDFWRRRPKYSLPPSTLEYAVSIAASLSRFYLQHRRAVGLVTAGQSLQVLPADRGGRQLGKILESLALIQAEGAMPLHNLVDVQARHLPRGSTAVLITPSVSQLVFQTADILLRRGFRPVTVLIDAVTFGGILSSDELIASLHFLGIPVCRVSYGDELTETLSSVVQFPR
jgi:uncharacterized protein (DUF58 family)